MALKKEMELDNGVILNYHRITSLNKITNISNIIEISSYTNEKQREKEKKYQKLQQNNTNKNNNDSSNNDNTNENDDSNNDKILLEEEELKKGIDVYINTNYLSVQYDPTMTIIKAYDYLKTLDIFKNAIDI